MAKYPPLTKEQKDKIAKYKDSPNKPSQIAKETNIPAKQIGGYLNFLRKGSPIVARQPPSETKVIPSQSKASPGQETLSPSQVKPSPNEPLKITKVNGPDKPKIQEVKKMAIDEQDLAKIQELVAGAVTKSKEEQAKETAGVVGTALKTFREEEKKEQERLDKEREKVALEGQLKDLFNKAKPGDIASLCEQYPELCKKVETLEKKVKKEEEKPKEPTHTTAKEYLECPECSKALINTLGKMAKENEEFSKRVYESLSGQGALEIFKKFATPEGGKPKEGDKKDGKGKEGEKGKDKETPEGGKPKEGHIF